MSNDEAAVSRRLVISHRAFVIHWSFGFRHSSLPTALPSLVRNLVIPPAGGRGWVAVGAEAAVFALASDAGVGLGVLAVAAELAAAAADRAVGLGLPFLPDVAFLCVGPGVDVGLSCPRVPP